MICWGGADPCDSNSDPRFRVASSGLNKVVGLKAVFVSFGMLLAGSCPHCLLSLVYLSFHHIVFLQGHLHWWRGSSSQWQSTEWYFPRRGSQAARLLWSLSEAGPQTLQGRHALPPQTVREVSAVRGGYQLVREGSFNLPRKKPPFLVSGDFLKKEKFILENVPEKL